MVVRLKGIGSWMASEHDLLPVGRPIRVVVDRRRVVRDVLRPRPFLRKSSTFRTKISLSVVAAPGRSDDDRLPRARRRGVERDLPAVWGPGGGASPHE